MDNASEIFRVVEEARAFRHPQRAMRVLLECGHYRLMPWNATANGIGSITTCFRCENRPDRLVVNVEETGVLWSETFTAREPAPVPGIVGLSRIGNFLTEHFPEESALGDDGTEEPISVITVRLLGELLNRRAQAS